MKIRVSHGRRFVASTFQAGAVLLLNQPHQGQTGLKLTVPADIKQHDRTIDVAPITRSREETRTIISEVVVPIQLAWDGATQKLFKILAVKEALDEISSDEKRELESLTLLRRKEESSVNPEDIIWEYKQRKLADELMTRLEEYVEFHRPREHASRRQTSKAKG